MPLNRLAVAFLLFCAADAVFKQTLYYPPHGTQATCAALVYGVGTAMESSDYSFLATAVASLGHVVAVVDHAPGWPIKLNGDAFNAAFTAVKAELVANRSFACAAWSFVVGGHSAGGRAALGPATAAADAYWGTDPFDCSDVAAASLALPRVFWALPNTTCLVTASRAGAGGFAASPTGRKALYTLAVDTYHSSCEAQPSYGHCAFTDHGCVVGHVPVCKKCASSPDEMFYRDLAASFDALVATLVRGAPWAETTFALPAGATTKVNLRVQDHDPEGGLAGWTARGDARAGRSADTRRRAR